MLYPDAEILCFEPDPDNFALLRRDVEQHGLVGLELPVLRAGVDLLKLDVEGAERGVLSDLNASGALARVKGMHLEYHHHIEAERNDVSSMLAQLEQADFGYQLRVDQPRWPVPRAFQDISIYAYR